MANKSFGTKQLDLTGASGSPIITSPSDLSINATTVAISTNISVGGYFSSNVNVGAGYSIGIGTTIPVAELEVKGDIGLSGSIVATGNTFTVKTSDSERLRITPVGLVGIGTDNPSQELTIHGSTFTGITIKSDRTTSTDQIGGVSFMNQAVGVSTATMNALVDGTMLFKTAGDESLRLDASGNVLCKSSTSYFGLPRVTTSGKSSLSNLVNGSMIYNTSENRVEVRVGGQWRQFTTENII